MDKRLFLVRKKLPFVSLAFAVVLSGFLVTGCGVKQKDQEKALEIIHQAEPNFEQLAQDTMKSDSSFEETKRGSFDWKFDRKSISHQIFARYGYWSNPPKLLMFVGSVLEEVFGVNPWPSDKGIYIGLTVDLDAGTVREMTEFERLYWEK